MNPRTGITAAGTWIVDYTKIVSQFPEEGACTSVLAETINNGGAPYNLLVDLRRLGAEFPLRAIGCVGRDVDGASILDDSRAHGIDLTRMRVCPESPTSFSDVMCAEETGLRTSFNHAGANALLDENDCDLRQDESRIFYLGTLLFLAALDARDPRHGTKAAAVLADARKRGMWTCVDIERVNFSASAIQGQVRAALHETDLPIFNVEVAERLTGIRIRYPAGVEIAATLESAEKLLSFGNGRCAVIRFPSGALALSASGESAVEGSVRLPKEKVRGAAGSGHAFTAGFLLKYHDQRPLGECLKTAHSAAAACLLDPTTSGGIKSAETCHQLMNQYGQRELGHHTLAAVM